LPFEGSDSETVVVGFARRSRALLWAAGVLVASSAVIVVVDSLNDRAYARSEYVSFSIGGEIIVSCGTVAAPDSDGYDFERDLGDLRRVLGMAPSPERTAAERERIALAGSQRCPVLLARQESVADEEVGLIVGATAAAVLGPAVPIVASLRYRRRLRALLPPLTVAIPMPPDVPSAGLGPADLSVVEALILLALDLGVDDAGPDLDWRRACLLEAAARGLMTCESARVHRWFPATEPVVRRPAAAPEATWPLAPIIDAVWSVPVMRDREGREVRRLDLVSAQVRKVAYSQEFVPAIVARLASAGLIERGALDRSGPLQGWHHAPAGRAMVIQWLSPQPWLRQSIYYDRDHHDLEQGVGRWRSFLLNKAWGRRLVARVQPGAASASMLVAARGA